MPLITLKVARSTQAGVHARHRHTRSYCCTTSARASDTTSPWPPSARPRRASTSTACSIGGRSLRTCQRTISCRSAAFAEPSELHQRDLRDRVRNDKGDTARVRAELPSTRRYRSATPARSACSMWPATAPRPRRQRFDGMRGDHGVAAAPDSVADDDVAIDFDRHVGRRRLRRSRRRSFDEGHLVDFAQGGLAGSTRSTADSRSSRMPCSRAARLISEIGRFSRIISRM